MNIVEAHIEFDVMLAQLGSYIGDYISPYKKDWFLHIAQLQYIKTHVLGGRDEDYEAVRIEAEAIQSLIEHRTLPVNIRDGEGFAILPSNYLTGCSEEAQVSSVCADTLNTVAANLSYIVFKFNNNYSAESVANKFVGFKIDMITDSDPVNLFTLATYYPSGIDKDLWWYMIPLILRYAAKSGVEVYWERWNDIYRPGSFIFVQEPGAAVSMLSLTITYNTSPSQTVSVSALSRSFDRYAVPETTLEYMPVRLLTNEAKKKIKINPFRKTRKISPAMFIQQNELKLPLRGFAIYNVKTEYYRNPLPPNFVTGQGLEIGVGTRSEELIHRQIINDAVRLAAATTSADNYQLLRLENELSK